MQFYDVDQGARNIFAMFYSADVLDCTQKLFGSFHP